VKIGVCLKVVPASDTAIKVAGPDAGVDNGAVNSWVINPYDEFALEEAVQLKEAKKASSVTVFTIGAKKIEKQMREALAKGADAAVRLEDGAFDGSDSLGIARILAAAAKAEGVELLFFGKQAIDGDNAQVPAMVAEIMGWPQVLVVDKLEVEGGSLKAWRDAGSGAREVVESGIPAVISTDKGLNEPRYSNLRAIMMAKRKKIAVKGAGDLGLDPGQVGAAGAYVKLSNWGLPPARPAGRMLDGEPAQQVKELVSLLRNEAKVL
jgi:electron transfer flavoprotein beta subunit